MSTMASSFPAVRFSPPDAVPLPLYPASKTNVILQEQVLTEARLLFLQMSACFCPGTKVDGSRICSRIQLRA